MEGKAEEGRGMGFWRARRGGSTCSSSSSTRFAPRSPSLCLLICFLFSFTVWGVGSSGAEVAWLAGADDHRGVPRWRQRLRGAEALRVPED
jgi:hypothetical protein